MTFNKSIKISMSKSPENEIKDAAGDWLLAFGDWLLAK
jgi:hypothetical protein